MKVVLLCGGQGTRLREHTELVPKPMVEVGGRPILWHIMKSYAHYGFTDFVICLGYKGDVIRRYFLDYEAMNCDFSVTLGQPDSIRYHGAAHGEDGWRVLLADTGQGAMTGARIKHVARHLGPETFAVTYGDGVADVDLRQALAFHRQHGALATVTGVRPLSRFGELVCRGDSVAAFSEKPQVREGLINGGFFFFEPGFLEYLSEDDACILERDPLERCAADGQLRVFQHVRYWQCMDTYRDWLELQRQWDTGHAPWMVWQ